MSATYHVTPPTEAGAMAHVNFRVRCETLGHGEDVYLLQEGDVKRQKVRTCGVSLEDDDDVERWGEEETLERLSYRHWYSHTHTFAHTRTHSHIDI